MANQPNARQFLLSDAALLIRTELETMATNKGFNTRSLYSPNEIGSETFVDKHMKYLSLHTKINPQQYILNLKLRTRISITK